MDRTIVYPASIPQDTDILSVNRNAMLAIGSLAQATFGTNVVADGLSCEPTSPASMSVLIGPGSITYYGPVDATAYGSLPADTSQSIVKMGINLNATTLTLTAPGGSNTAINYLVEASFVESDSSPIVLPYYNAANPSQPYSGPNNAGTAQNTVRGQSVQVQLVAGTAAPNGQQVTPSPDPGWVGLYVITVYNSMTTISGGTVAVYPQAPFLPFKLPALAPGQSSMAVFSNTQEWTPPFGVNLVKLRMIGGGGAGGAGGGGAGGGGAGAGSVEGYYPVTPGTPVLCTVGPGGTGGSAGANSSFGTAAVASGGTAGGVGGNDSGGLGGNTAGTGSGIGLLLTGASGQNGFASTALLMSGGGGSSSFGAGPAGVHAAPGANTPGANASLPGTGAPGGTGSAAGGDGGPGLIILEW